MWGLGPDVKPVNGKAAPADPTWGFGVKPVGFGIREPRPGCLQRGWASNGQKSKEIAPKWGLGPHITPC